MASPNLQGVINLDFTYKTKTSGASETNALTTPANFVTIAAIDAALTAANSTYYTALQLTKMSVNDKTYALRQISDAATI